MRGLTRSVQNSFAAVGLSVGRVRPVNRFDGMAGALGALASAGFRPTVIVDAGANRAQWAHVASAVFPQTALHLIEPQSACAASLAAFRSTCPSTEVHLVAVTRPGVDRVRMADAASGSTGAHVLRDGETAGEDVWLPSTTLDGLLGDRLHRTDCVLLKLDLEGHELEALEGARVLLAQTEVVVTETQFYEIDKNGRPTFGDVVASLETLGYMLYDIAALAPRPRDGRLRSGDLIFVRRDSALCQDDSWT
jgi:FkbM family methyltransferase